jgi:hypothetical protein
MLTIQSALDALLIEIHKKANLQLEELINKLLQQVLYPSVIKSNTICVKHTELLPIYREIAKLKSKYNVLRNDEAISSTQFLKVEAQCALAREAYRHAPCICHIGTTKVIPKETAKWIPPYKFNYDLPISFDTGSGW